MKNPKHSEGPAIRATADETKALPVGFYNAAVMQWVATDVRGCRFFGATKSDAEMARYDYNHQPGAKPRKTRGTK